MISILKLDLNRSRKSNLEISWLNISRVSHGRGSRLYVSEKKNLREEKNI